MHVLIVAAGRPPDRDRLAWSWPGWDEAIDLVIAADGGADTAADLGFRVDLAVGDFDSIGPGGIDRLRSAGVRVEAASTAKDESDTELAIRAALARGADALTVVGGLGGRPDHLLANLSLLALPELADRSVVLLDESTRVRLIRGPGRQELAGRVGDLISLLPLGSAVDGVLTGGLAWALHDEPLSLGPARGLSNVRVEPVASVAVRIGLLLAVETAVEPASARLPG
jgi:thiamine pyrophosphokinase